MIAAKVPRCLVAVLCVLVGACGRAQWREADAKLYDAALAARGAGFSPLSGRHNTFGTFTAGGMTRWRVHLEAHQPYFIAAACTAGCDSLDFAVSEPHGHAVGADTTSGPTPRLELIAPEEGDYAITFRYTRCTAPQCRWAAQLYTKRSPSSP